MKKYLINGAMALIVGGFIVSCSHDDISQPATVDQMTKSFDEMFKELYGPIAPNHNWGFETIAAETGEEEATEETTEEATEEKASTRSAERAATRATVQVTTSSEYPTRHLQSEYKTIFNNLTNSGKSFEFVSSGSFKFSVIYAHTSAKDEIGCYYYNPESEVPTGNHKVSCIGNVQNIGDYVLVTESHIPNWTSWLGLGWKRFNPQDNGEDEWYRSFTNVLPYQGAVAQTFTVDVTAGNRVGFYIKKENGDVLYTNASLNSNGLKPATYSGKFVGFEDNTGTSDYHDVIIEVLSGETANTSAKSETTTTITRTYKEIVDIGRVFCEDIATAEMKVTDDVDYNDIVFDARVWEIYDQDETTINGIKTKSGKKNIKYQYDISMLAAGGTIPETVGVNNVDVHDAFGVGLTFMVNTWTENSKAFGQYNTPTNVMKPKDEVISYPLDYNDPAQVEKYKLNKDNVGIKSIPINVLYKNGYQSASVALENGIEEESVDENGNITYRSNAPYKICVPIGTLWPIERVNIRDAYTAFGDYVKDSSKKFYGNSSTQEAIYLYDQAPESKIQHDLIYNKWDKGTTLVVSESPSSSTVDVVWEGNVSSDGTAITLYNFNFKQGQKLRFFGSGTIRVVGNNAAEIFKSIPMSNGYYDIDIDTKDQAANLNGGSIIINGSKFSLTKIVVLKK